MTNLVLVLVCLCLGLAFQRSKQFSEQSAAALNTYVIFVALPALVLHEIPKMPLTVEALWPILVAWMVMGFSFAVIFTMAKLLSWSRAITGATLLVVTLGNTSFIGIPLIEAHLGQQAIPFAILYDQLGTFIALNTFGITVASLYAVTPSEYTQPIWKKIISFPPFLSLLLATVLYPLDYPDWAEEVLARLASTLVPVVMVAVGLQWRLRLDKQHRLPLLISLSIILVLEPAFALAVVSLFGVEGLVSQVIVLQAAMPAMISAGVLATAHNLEPRLTSAIVGYSLTIALASVWVWRLIVS